jgi:serine phosphatase RsbU (regulator of sigma subunit)
MSQKIAQFDKYREKLDIDLMMAEQVHRSLIPVSERRGNLDVACHCSTVIGIGGDYASVYFQDDTHVVATICDVSGHGIAASLLAGRVNSFVLNEAPRVQHPCQIVDALNKFISEYFGTTGMYLTFFCIFLDLEHRFLIHSGCGHPPALLYSKRKNTVEQLESENNIIGIIKVPRVCSMLKTPFEVGDRLILYTDGITESRNVRGEFLGVEGLIHHIKKCVQLSTKNCVKSIINKVEKYRDGNPANDDQLLLALTFMND